MSSNSDSEAWMREFGQVLADKYKEKYRIERFFEAMNMSSFYETNLKRETTAPSVAYYYAIRELFKANRIGDKNHFMKMMIDEENWISARLSPKSNEEPWNLPVRDANYVERTKFSDQLKNYLKVDYQDSLIIVGCIGLGGIGKTSLANDYEHKAKNFEIMEKDHANKKNLGSAYVKNAKIYASIANDYAKMANDYANKANLENDSANKANICANKANDFASLANDYANMANESANKANLENDYANEANVYAVMAIEYANKAIDDAYEAKTFADNASNLKNYKLIAWFNANPGKNLTNQFEEFGKQLFNDNGSVKNEKNKKEDKSQIPKIKKWLKTNPGWLFIFDELESWDELNEIIPKHGGKVLFTSRNPYFDFANGMNSFLIKLENFDEKESISYFKKSYFSGNDKKIVANDISDAEIENFAKIMDFHPFAIKQAILYMKKAEITLKDYVGRKEREFRTNFRSLSSESSEEGNVNHSLTDLFEKFDSSLSDLDENAKTRAISYLTNCAHFDDENKIPKRIFGDITDATLVKLNNKSLIKFDDYNSKLFSVRRIIQEWIFYKLNQKKKTDELSRTYSRIESVYPMGKFEMNDLELKKELFPHLISLLEIHAIDNPYSEITKELNSKISKMKSVKVEIEIDKKIEFKNLIPKGPVKFGEKFESDKIIDSKIYAVNGLMQMENRSTNSDNYKKSEKQVRDALKIFKNFCHHDDVYYEFALELMFHYIKKHGENFKEMIEKDKKAKAIYETLLKKPPFSRQLPFSFDLEFKGFVSGQSKERNVQLESYITAFQTQWDSVNGAGQIEWEEFNKDSICSYVSTIEKVKGLNSNENEGHVIGKYIFRNNSSLPGMGLFNKKFIHNKEVYIMKDCIEDVVRFEVLKIKEGTYKWILSTNKEIPKNAIPGGKVNGQDVYIGRVYKSNWLNKSIPIIGYVRKSNQYCVCVVPNKHDKLRFKNYEILINTRI